MRRSEAERYAASGQECLRLRSDRDYLGERVIIRAVGYKRNHYYSPDGAPGHPSPGATGCLVDVLRFDGTVARQEVYPLAQLHATTQAERRGVRERAGEIARQARMEAEAQQRADLAEARQLAEQLQHGRVDTAGRGWGEVFIRLSLAEARALAALLAEHDAVFVPDFDE